jgi:hypothetical protein
VEYSIWVYIHYGKTKKVTSVAPLSASSHSTSIAGVYYVIPPFEGGMISQWEFRVFVLQGQHIHEAVLYPQTPGFTIPPLRIITTHTNKAGWYMNRRR